MIHIIKIDLFDVNLLCFFPKIDPIGVYGRLRLSVGHGQWYGCYRRHGWSTSAHIGLSLLLQLLLLDELNLAHVVSHIFKALCFKRSHECLVRL